MQSSCDLDAVVQPHPQNSDAPVKPHLASHSGDIRPRPPSGEPPPRRRRSGDVRMRSGDPHTRSDRKINKSEPEHNNRTRSGDARIRSHDQELDTRTRSGDARVRSHDKAVISHDERKQPKSPPTASAPSTQQQVTTEHDNSGTHSSSTSHHSKSHISQSDCNKPATPTVAATTPAKFNWEEQVTPVLSAINSASKSDTEMLCELCANLWTTLQLSNTIGRSGKSKQRSSVLRAMFQLLDSKDSRLLLRATKIILAVSYEFV